MVKGSLPAIGCTARLFKSAVEQAYCKGVSAGVKAELIKQYVIGTKDPKMIKRGHVSYSIKIDTMLTDYAFLTNVLGGTTCTIIVYPGDGTKTGEAKLTFSNMRLNDWELTITEDGPVLESVSGEAEGMTTGSAP